MSADSNILKLQQRGLLQNVFPEAKLVISRLFCNMYSKTYATLWVRKKQDTLFVSTLLHYLVKLSCLKIA